MKTTKTFIERKLEEFDLTFFIPRRATNPLTIELEEALIERNILTKIFISQALTDQAQEILEMEELKLGHSPYCFKTQYPDDEEEECNCGNDIRSQIKAAIRGKYEN